MPPSRGKSTYPGCSDFRNHLYIDDASNSSEAFQKLQVRAYGLVISDSNMEPMTGYELLQQVRGVRQLFRSVHHGDRRIAG